MAGKAIQVNGAPLVLIGPQGKSGALSELGIPLGGVDISFDLMLKDVMADSGGGEDGVPVDVIDKGKMAFISMRLAVYDPQVPEDLIDMGANAGNLEPAAGTLLIANNRCNRLVIQSPIQGQPWRFFFAHLVSPLDLPGLSTDETHPALKFRALPGTGNANTQSGLPLFDHVAA